MVSTHSPDLLNAARRICEIKQYMEQGDKMGYLWKQGFFAGANPA
jgi:hypothetical protein